MVVTEFNAAYDIELSVTEVSNITVTLWESIMESADDLPWGINSLIFIDSEGNASK